MFRTEGYRNSEPEINEIFISGTLGISRFSSSHHCTTQSCSGGWCESQSSCNVAGQAEADSIRIECLLKNDEN